MSIFFLCTILLECCQRKRTRQRNTHQSILELGYHFPVQYGAKEHFALIVLLNGLLGGFLSLKIVYSHTRKRRIGLYYL